MLSELTDEKRKCCSREVGSKMELKVSSIAFMLLVWLNGSGMFMHWTLECLIETLQRRVNAVFFSHFVCLFTVSLVGLRLVVNT